MEAEGDNTPGKRKSLAYAALAGLFFFCCFILAPLGNFFVWVSVGGALYFGFMAIYMLVTTSPKEVSGPAKKMSERELETKAYIQKHLPMVISILLGGLLLAIVILFFFA